MSLGKEIGKIIVLAVVGLPFFFIGGPVLFPLLYLTWKYVKLCVKVDIFVIYFLIRMPLWLLIQVPLWAFGRGVDKVQNFVEHALNFLSRKRKTAIATVIGIFLLFFFFFPLDFAGFSSISLSNIYQNVVALGMLSVVSLTISMLLFAIMDTFGGGSIARSPRNAPNILGTDPATGVAGAAGHGREWAENAQEGYEKARKAKGVYDDIRSKGVKNAAKDSIWPNDLINQVKGLKAEFSSLGGGEAAAAEAEGREAAAALSSNPAGLVIIGIILSAIIIFIAQLVIVVLYFFSIAQFWLPIVGGTLMGALGLGADYTEWIGTTTANKYLAGTQIDVAFEEEIDALRQARQRVYCLLQGPACLRQWRLNHTKRPGTNAVGETYGLQISGFSAGSGNQIDVGYRTGSYQIPISFRLYNTRHGLKGINAKDVKYRVKIIDFNRGRNDPLCSTGWKNITTYDIDNDGYENDLYPGTSAATGFITLDKLTLRNCGLLQPGAGSYKTVQLDVKYDYFSQATLNIQAMARQTLTSNPNIKQHVVPSRTADTPVKSILNAPTPVLYNQETLEAQPFTVRARLKTDEGNVHYKVRNFVLTKSDKVKIFQNLPNRECQFRKVKGTRNKLVPESKKSSGPEILARGKDKGRWYSVGNNPPFFGCPMNLTNPGTISPTGETLTMGVEANYTVKLDKILGRFKVINSRCSTLNCPLLVPAGFAEEQQKPDNWRYKCSGLDASNGCEVVKPRPSQWDNPVFMTGTRNNPALDAELEQGEFAIDPLRRDTIQTLIQNGELSLYSSSISDTYDKGEVAIGLNARQLGRIKSFNAISDPKGYALISVKTARNGREVNMEEFNFKLCQNLNSVDKAVKAYKQTLGSDAIVISFEISTTTKCGDPERQARQTTAGDVTCESGVWAYNQIRQCVFKSR